MDTSACDRAMPLDVLLKLMEQALADKDHKLAADMAKAAAPYLHVKATAKPKAAAVELMTDDELRHSIRAIFANDDQLPR